VKKIGIPMGIPYFQIKQIVREKNIVIFSSNFTLYRDISARVMEIAASIVEDLEVYSIDEAFFKLPAVDAEARARELAHTVRRHVGVPVSVGISTTKTLAKLAGASAKKGDGFAHLLSSDAHIPLTSLYEIWGVCAHISERLMKRGMTTVGDVLHHGPGVMREVLGVVGERLYYELSGIEAQPPAMKAQSSSMSSRSFGKHVRTYAELADAVSHHLSEIARKLRQKRTKAPGVVLYLRFIDEDDRAASVSYTVRFPTPLSDTRSMAKLVLSTLTQAFDARVRYVKAGITAYDITDIDALQPDLFQAEQDVSNDTLMNVVDGINSRFGARALRMGTQHATQVWKSRAQFLSPSYTTSWTSLPMADMK
jgi:DNA polymerase V